LEGIPLRAWWKNLKLIWARKTVDLHMAQEVKFMVIEETGQHMKVKIQRCGCYLKKKHT